MVVMSLQGRVIYNSAAGLPENSSQLRFDDSTVYPDSRLNTVNLHINEAITVDGKMGIATANPRVDLEVAGYSVMSSQGSDSSDQNEFGLNGSYDTLSIMSPYGVGTGGKMSIFFGLQSIINYPIARIVAVDTYSQPSLAFQTGQGASLIERMRIDSTGYVGVARPSPICAMDISGDLAISGSSYLYKTFTFSTTGSEGAIQSGSFQLAFPSISTISSATIDVEMSIMRNTVAVTTGILKFTVYLGYYNPYGLGVFLNNISTTLTNGLEIDPRTITPTSSASVINVIIPYRYLSENSAQIVSVKYSIQGTYAYEMNIYGIRLITISNSSPDPPTNVVASNPGNQTATVSWQTPSNSGSYPVNSYTRITNYTVTYTGGVVNTASLSANITGLTNGTTYTFTVSATNSIGTSNASVASNSVVPYTLPSAPLGVSAVSGLNSATVSWSAPSSDGGSAITSYSIIYNGITTSTTGTTITINSLANGTAYTFIVNAVNAAGNSPGASSTVTTPNVPGAPLNPSSVADVSQVTLYWQTPSTDGGTAITGYTVMYNGNTINLGNVLTTTISGLANQTNYNFTIYAVNVLGNSGPASVSANTPTVPTAPLNASATPGVRQATVSWQTPSSNGGTAITGYTVTYNGNTINLGNILSTIITGLANGTTYTFSVYAINVIGSSAAATTSTITLDIPSIPTGLSSRPGNGSVSLSWNPSSSNGGSVTYYISWPGASDSTTATSYTANGLTNGSSYTFTIYAANAVGNSGSASVTGSSGSVPSPPQNVSATAGEGQATVSWSASADNGGLAITSYFITYSGGASYPGNTLSTVISGLANGTSYAFTVYAVNAIGNSGGSTSNSVTPVISIPPTFNLSRSANRPGSYYFGDDITLPVIPGVSYFKIEMLAGDVYYIEDDTYYYIDEGTGKLSPGGTYLIGTRNMGKFSYRDWIDLSYRVIAYDSNNTAVSYSPRFDTLVGDATYDSNSGGTS